MKIVFFGYDFFSAALEQLLRDGHELGEVFTFATDNVYDHNTQTLALAASAGAPTYFRPASVDDIARWKADGVDLLLTMAYPFKIPAESALRGLNLHPTMLPNGRGRWPLPRLLTEPADYCGLTLHKHTERWDDGDIVAQVRVPRRERDTLESLSARLQMAAAPFVSDTLRKLDRRWNEAKPQGAGSYWKMPADADRVLDWSAGVDSVMRTVRAYGKFESTALLDANEWMVTDADGWLEPHEHRPGEVVHRMGRECVVATSDGFVLLRFFHKEQDLSKP